MPITYESKLQDLSNITNKVSKKNTEAMKLYIRARALFIQRLFKESVQAYLQSLMFDRTNPTIYIDLAIAYRELGEFEKSIDALNKASKLDNNNLKIFLEKGITYSYMGKHKQALENVRNAVSRDNDNPEILLQLALAHEASEEYDFALMIYDVILEKHPAFYAAQQNKAALFMELKEYQVAATIFQDILKKNPNFHRAYLGVAVCFDHLQEYGSALRYYRKFMLKKPNSKSIPDVLIRINEIKQILDKRLTSSLHLC